MLARYGKLFPILLLVMILCFIVLFGSVKRIAVLWNTSPQASGFSSNAIKSIDTLLRRSENAILKFPHIKQSQFVPSSISPFAPATSLTQPLSSRQFSVSKSNRVPLVLKGVLLKSQALAIVADPSGKTWIVGIKEKVFNQEIVAISSDKVSLRDSFGSYDLFVKE